ncbi:MAG: cytochrome P460 family protein [Acidobacteriaceae bacterium]
MFTTLRIAFLLGFVFLSAAAPLPADQVPQYTSGGELEFPQNYRDWVYLTTGFDMSYSASTQMDSHHMFDNVFVNPEAYQSYMKTGTWPDHTMLVLEVRAAPGRGSINQKGNFQGERMAVEVHVKDKGRFPESWAFFGFEAGGTPATSAKRVPTTADCYSCHAAHAAVDTTFVQFYPTLLPVANAKGTLSAEYLKELAVPAKK